MKAKFSVAMCTYNGGRFLEEQLLSIAGQTRLPFELVVCDDHSTDATCKIVQAFAASAPFPVRLYVNERNLGSTKNFEHAISLCQGDIIALADQDDVWLPQKMSCVEDSFARNPQLGMVFTNAEVVDERLQPLGYRLWDSIGFDRAHQRHFRDGRALDVLLPGVTVTGATMAFRSTFKSLIIEIPTNLALIHDGWIAAMIASVAEVSLIEEPLIKYRQHNYQQIGAKERKTNQTATGLGGLKDALRRKNSYQQMIDIGTQVQRRLLEHRDVYEINDALSNLEARLKHLRARAQLPNSRLSRVHSALAELLSGRYHLYSNGFRSAFKDLFD